ncbi:hypothetical protein L3Q82_022658 [Scortum barcoo]|uniref:Uncharacterized protein n=1 Tax=Scortum barcoo TaxID=214431 RepID=A0ACB8WXA1_9TELE|nr:hypothetical protein L3Q82_022658 [Scortum barcoo]
MRNCAVLCLMETWLNDNMPEPAFQIDGRLFFRADRNQQSGKARGGGLCVYVNKGWCTNCTLVNSHCSEAIEHMTIKCRPHCLAHTEPSPTPTWASSDHISIMLVPAYRPLLRRHTPTQRTITVWPSDAVPALQDCFQRTDWQIFREAAVREEEVDLEDYTSAVLGYINKCTEDVHQHQDSNRISEPETLAECGGPVPAESQGCCDSGLVTDWHSERLGDS